MRTPDQSLDDYTVRPPAEATSRPPRPVTLRRTGEVEVVQPLTPRLKVRLTPGRYAFKAPNQPLWFRRFLAAGSGALVVVGFVLVSAILVGISDPALGPDVATNGTPDEQPTQNGEPFSFDIPSPSTFAPTTGGVEIVRSNTRRRPTRRSVRAAVNKQRRRSLPTPQPEQPKFVPTTLVIYAENGVINTRIEPWVHTFNN